MTTEMGNLMTIVQRMDNIDFSAVSTAQKRNFISAEAKKISLDKTSTAVLLKRNNC